MRRRHRIIIWTDEAGQPEQAAVAVFIDDEPVREHTWTPEPFFGVTDVAREAYEHLALQGRLF